VCVLQAQYYFTVATSTSYHHLFIILVITVVYWDLSYSDRLQKFGLNYSGDKKIARWFDSVFKMFKGFDTIKLNDFFKLSSTSLRGHILKIYKPQVHLDVRKFFHS